MPPTARTLGGVARGEEMGICHASTPIEMSRNQTHRVSNFTLGNQIEIDQLDNATEGDKGLSEGGGGESWGLLALNGMENRRGVGEATIKHGMIIDCEV